MRTGDRRVVVIGLDGATWNLLAPWAERGELPNLAALMRDGRTAPLESTTPAVTFPAWESLFTGLNPGKLGVYDFVGVDPAERSFNINTPGSFGGRPVWRLLNEHGYRAGTVGIPTSAVRPMDGVMVGGPFSDGNVSYPEGYLDDLGEPGYETYPDELSKSFMESTGSPPDLDRVRAVIDSRFRVAEKILDREDPAFLAFVVFLIDNIQHFYWGDDVVLESWRHIDRRLGEFVSRLENTTVLIVSDHGFTGFRSTVFLSTVLADEGLLRYNREGFSRMQSVLTQGRLIGLARTLRLDSVLRRVVDQELLLKLLSRFPSESGRIGGKGLEELVDWDASRCVPLSSSIYFTCPEDERPELAGRVVERLERVEGVRRVHRREDLYSGRYVDLAPDLVVEPEEGCRVLETPFRDAVTESEPVRGWRGVHRKDGVLLVHDTEGRPPELVKERPRITDVAPTVLSLFGIETPSEMDGESLIDNGAPGEAASGARRIRAAIRRIRGEL